MWFLHSNQSTSVKPKLYTLVNVVVVYNVVASTSEIDSGSMVSVAWISGVVTAKYNLMNHNSVK